MDKSSQTKSSSPSSDKQTPERSLQDVVRAFMLYIFVGALWTAAIFFGYYPVKAISGLIPKSSHPVFAMLLLAAASASTLFLIVRMADILGLTSIGFLGGRLDKLVANPKLRSYVRALPIGFHLGVVGVVLVVELFLLPFCQPPGAMVFTVNDRETYTPSSTVFVPAGETLTITAKPVEENTPIRCEWQQAGDAFDSINVTTGCSVTLSVANRNGQGVLTLVSSRWACPQKSFFPIIIQVHDNEQ